VGGAGARALAPHDDAVLAALREIASHPTAGEVYDAVRRRYPHVGRATVYRALQRLVAAGLAVEVGRDSLGRHYDARTDRHDHAICTGCGRVLDILPEDDLPEDLLAELTRLAQDAGVAVDTYEIRLYGRCAACRDAQTVPARSRYSNPTRGGTDE
jgi:Fe2+ or Zn2+ uptake regulation protein